MAQQTVWVLFFHVSFVALELTSFLLPPPTDALKLGRELSGRPKVVHDLLSSMNRLSTNDDDGRDIEVEPQTLEDGADNVGVGATSDSEQRGAVTLAVPRDDAVSSVVRHRRRRVPYHDVAGVLVLNLLQPFALALRSCLAEPARRIADHVRGVQWLAGVYVVTQEVVPRLEDEGLQYEKLV